MREIILRAWDGKGFSIGKPEYFDDSINFRFHHFDIDCEKPILERYTGLKDKNGAMIFEGDILRDGKGEDGVVTYIDSIACFMAVRDGKEAWDLNEGDPTRPNKLQYTEIIGNIHEEGRK